MDDNSLFPSNAYNIIVQGDDSPYKLPHIHVISKQEGYHMDFKSKSQAELSASRNGCKFQENGRWGLKSRDGRILFEAEYDQLEICSDYIYVHSENRHAYYYYDGCLSYGPDWDDDYRFYKAGKMGLLDKEGNVLLPPIYDEIDDWGEGCDVIYTRIGKEFHYYNHQKEEILTEYDFFPEDAYPECPYNLGEDMNRNVLLCVEPAGLDRGANCCYAFGQWVKLTRIPLKDVGSMFSSCDIMPMPELAVAGLYSDSTYIYSARYCKSDGETPAFSCIKKMETLETFDASWFFLVKIAVNHHTTVDTHDLCQVCEFFETLDSECCMDYHVCIDYDDALSDGEVSVLLVRYYAE